MMETVFRRPRLVGLLFPPPPLSQKKQSLLPFLANPVSKDKLKEVNSSDGCTSTPGTSPKSSDEGFESEKDKEAETQGGISSPPQEVQQQDSSTAGRRTVPARDSKVPSPFIPIPIIHFRHPD